MSKQWSSVYPSKKKKVTLVYPPSPFLLEEHIVPPLGILYLGSVLKQAGHDVSVVDLTGIADWRNNIQPCFDADLVGYTCTTPQFPIVRRIRDELKTKGYTGAQSVGGIHPTSDPFGVSEDNWDGVCVGEGEVALLHMLSDMDVKGKPSGIYREPLVPNLDDFGHPARELLDIRAYEYFIGGRRSSTIFSQRGCIFSCQFCESPLAGGGKIRYHSSEFYKDEFLILRDLGFGGVQQFDDEANLDLPRLKKNCELVAPLDMKWRCFFVVSRSSVEILSTMKNAGCHEILVGFESGSPEILRNIRKPQTVDIMRKFAREISQVGLRWKAACIVGLPGETWDTVRMTERLLEECNPSDLDVSILQIYPGSPIAMHEDYYKNLGLSWNIDYKNLEDLWYKSSPEKYQELIQVETAGMTKADLIAARMYLESKFKPPEWRDKFIKKVPWERLDADLPYVREWARKLQQ